MQTMPSVSVPERDEPDLQTELEAQADAVVTEATRLQDLTLTWSRSLAERNSATPSDTKDAIRAVQAAVQAVETELQRIDGARKSEQDSTSGLLKAAHQLQEEIEGLIATLETHLVSDSGTTEASDSAGHGEPVSESSTAPVDGSPAVPDSQSPADPSRS
jgi:chromosome segregation ATPase